MGRGEDRAGLGFSREGFEARLPSQDGFISISVQLK